MRCLPGFFPVMNDVQAGGVIGGRTDARRPEAPSFISWARLGNLPSPIHGSIRSNVAASRPTIITFILLIRHIWAHERFAGLLAHLSPYSLGASGRSLEKS